MMDREIIIISMAKGWGGAEEYLELLRRELTNRGLPYRIIVREGKEYAIRSATRDNLFAAPHSPLGYLRFLGKHFRAGQGRKVIHVNRYYDVFRGIAIKRKFPGSVLILYQHCYLNHPHSIPLKMVDGIISISKFVEESITARFPEVSEKSRVINPGIDLSLFSRGKSGYGIEGAVKVGLVGRFDKNQEEFFSVAGILKRKGIDIKIHLVGDGGDSEKERLRSAASKNGLDEATIFRGTIPHEEIGNFYREMDIIVSTMRIEGLSLVAMEAMASGLPFVSYGSSGFNELIDHEKNGILVDGGPEEFARWIEKLIQSETLRSELGRGGQRKAKESFGIETSVNRYLDFVKEVSF